MQCQCSKRVKNDCPFIVDGKIDFPIIPLNAGLFLWPDILPAKVGSIIIPEDYQEKYRNSTGLVLAVGPGFFSRKRERFMPTETKPGDLVVFDKSVLWRVPVMAPDNKEYVCWGMGEADIFAIIRCEGCGGE